MQGETFHENRARVSRVRLTKTNDSGKQQLLDYEGVAGEKHTEVLRAQYFGLSSHAPKNSEGVVLATGGRDAPVVVGIESPDHRPTDLPEGGSRLYDMAGSYVDLDANGNIVAVSATAITLRTPNLTIEGNVTIKGDVETTGKIVSAGPHIAAAHV